MLTQSAKRNIFKRNKFQISSIRFLSTAAGNATYSPKENIDAEEILQK